MNRTVLVLGLTLVAGIVAVLYTALGNDPTVIDSPLVGRPAPPFALRAAGTGETIDLGAFRGKPVVLNFWATWCQPCWHEHPVLSSNAERLGPRVQFLGVVFQDEESKITSFLKERGWAYPSLVDDRGKTAIAYGVGGVPETFFLDASGRIVAKHAGPLSDEILAANLAKVLR